MARRKKKEPAEKELPSVHDVDNLQRSLRKVFTHIGRNGTRIMITALVERAAKATLTELMKGLDEPIKGYTREEVILMRLLVFIVSITAKLKALEARLDKLDPETELSADARQYAHLAVYCEQIDIPTEETFKELTDILKLIKGEKPDGKK